VFAWKLVAVAVVTCALTLAVPALTDIADPDRGPAAELSSRSVATSEHRPQHTSDGEAGPIVAPIPTVLRAPATTSNRVSWRVTPGMTYTRWDQSDARGPIRAHLLAIDPSQPGLELDYASRGHVQSTAPLTDILEKDSAIAGINGDFYDIGDTGAPLGLGRDRQHGLLHARDSGWNSAFYLDRNGKPGIGTLDMAARIKEHPDLVVTNLNSPFVKPGGIGIYTRGWGRTAGYRVTDGQKREVRMVVIRDGRVRDTRQKLTNDNRIHGIVLIGRGDGARKLRHLRVGSKASVAWRLDQRTQMAITGNRFLVEDGLIKVVDDRELHPRTAVGIDDDTGEVLLLAIDGRKSWSRGYTMVELANRMIDLGADEALNFDGGGSSTMVARKSTGKVSVVNHPSDGGQRSVPNGLEVTYKP
jgi:hypothetical protein